LDASASGYTQHEISSSTVGLPAVVNVSCRAYRAGELPDIRAVTPSSIWGPLSALAAQRPAIASRLLSAVLASSMALAADASSGSAQRGSRLAAGARQALQVRHVLWLAWTAGKPYLAAAAAAAAVVSGSRYACRCQVQDAWP
jgi:hypothetical protein